MSKRIKAVIGALAVLIAIVTSACNSHRGEYVQPVQQYPVQNPVFIPGQPVYAPHFGGGPTYHSTTTVRVSPPRTVYKPAPTFKPAPAPKPAPKVSSSSRSK